MNVEKGLWEEKVEKIESFLVINFDPEFNFLIELHRRSVISMDQIVTEILAQPDIKGRLETLVRILSQESPRKDAFIVFRDTLKLFYKWITELSNDEENAVVESSTETIKKRIHAIRATLVDNIDPIILAKSLHKKHIITRQTLEEIVDPSDRKIRASNLVSFLLETGNPRAFIQFKEALKHDFLQICSLNGEETCCEEDILDGLEVEAGFGSGYRSEKENTNDVKIDSKISILERIGEGAYGLVYKVQHADYGIVAFKKMKFDYVHESDEDSLRQKADLHQKLNHPNIIKCLEVGVFLEPGNYGIIFELAEHGELRNYLKVNNEIKTRLKKLHEVSSGMKYLHSLNPPVIHGDLKIQNILVGENHKAKICDFGFSRWKIYSQSRSAKDVPRGTSTHIPPEYLKDNKLRKTETFDVYSFGICAWEIITLERPFANATGNEGLIQNWVSKGQRPPVTQYPFTVVPQIVIDVLESCWDNDVKIRPKFANIEKEVKPSTVNRYFWLPGPCKPKVGNNRK